MIKHDESLKKLYQIEKLVISLLRDFREALDLELELIKSLNFREMIPGPTEFIDNGTKKRLCDLVWRIPSFEHFVLFLLIEFQSTYEPDMVGRIFEYASMFEKRELRNRKPGDPEIRMRTLTIYTLDEPWRGSVIAKPSPGHLSIMPPSYHYGRVIDAKRFPLDNLNPAGAAVAAMRIEQIANALDAVPVLQDAFDHHEEDHVRLALYSRALELKWLNEPGGGQVSYEQLLAEYHGGTMAEAQRTRFDKIVDEYRSEGIALGRNEGIALGRDEGIELGRNEGIALGQRTLLHRWVAKHFDAETTERFVEHLEFIDDPEQLAELAEAILECETAEELLNLVRRT